MNKGFDWVPFYDEMASKLLDYRKKQKELIAVLAASGVGGLTDRGVGGADTPLTEIDPFTFLAMLNKQSHPERAKALARVKPLLKIDAKVPTDFLGIPKAQAQQTWLFPYSFQRHPGDIDKLWNLFEAVLSDKAISEAVFADACSVKYAGRAKLTQAIFRAAPAKYFPVDGQTCSYLKRLGLPYEFSSAIEFQEIARLVAKRVAKPLYEQSHDAWLANQPGQLNPEADYQRKVLEKAINAKPFVEKAGGVAVPKTAVGGSGGVRFQRNPAVAGEALRLANFKCEVDPGHQTFISSAKEKPYVEAHHLIPFGNQFGFKFSLDVTANIVALCPNCHRRLHHGRHADKSKEIKALLESRQIRLGDKELTITDSELLKMYRGDLLDEDA